MAARRRHRDARQDRHSRVRPALLHRAGRTPARPHPVGPAPLRRRVERRGGRRGRRGGADRPGLRRRRLDPDPRFGLRPGRAEAESWPDQSRAADGARPRPDHRGRGEPQRRRPPRRSTCWRATAPATSTRPAAGRELPGRHPEAAPWAAGRRADASGDRRGRGASRLPGRGRRRRRAAGIGLGHHLEEAPVPFGMERWAAFMALWTVGAATIPLDPAAEPLLTPLTRWLRDRGRQVGRAGARRGAGRAAAAHPRGGAGLARLRPGPHPDAGAAARPDRRVARRPDPASDFAAQTRFTPWTSVHNITGLPAISLPLHTAEVDGVRLPFGIMLAGRFGTEELLLAVAASLEEAVGGWARPPAAAD